MVETFRCFGGSSLLHRKIDIRWWMRQMIPLKGHNLMHSTDCPIPSDNRIHILRCRNLKLHKIFLSFPSIHRSNYNSRLICNSCLTPVRSTRNSFSVRLHNYTNQGVIKAADSTVDMLEYLWQNRTNPGVSVTRAAGIIRSASSNMALSLIFQLKPQFAMYLFSMNTEKATEFTEEPPAAHNKSNIKLNTSIFFIFYVHNLYHGATAPSGPGPPHYRGFLITLV